MHVRYTFIVLPAWLLLAACGAARDDADPVAPDPVAWVRSAVPGLLVVFGSLYQCVGYYTGGGGFRPAWHEAYEYIDDHRNAGDIVAGDEHAYWQARYYLGDSSPVRVMGTELWDLLESTEQRVWIVDKGGTSGAMRWSDLPERAELKWYFDRRILQPFSTVKIFVYDPADINR